MYLASIWAIFFTNPSGHTGAEFREKRKEDSSRFVLVVFSFSNLCSEPGLPDFSWYKHTKMGKYTKRPQAIPNGH
jgi:hypothetical protein